MAKYLVTGGCGFIGSHLADRLVEEGHKVRILDNLSTGKRENAPAEAEVLIGSICDLPLLEQAVEGVDGIFHMAAVASVQQSIDEWFASHQVNIGGTVALFEYAARRKTPVIYASSSAIYGDAPDFPYAESVVPSPLSPYGVDKLACEHHARVAWNVFGIPNVGFRFFNIYGPRQDPSSPYSGVISVFAKRLAEGKSLTIFGDGEQKRDFVYVDDVVRILTETMKRPLRGAKIYNICSGKPTSINALAELILSIKGSSAAIHHDSGREGEARVSLGDPSRLEDELQLKPSIPIEKGLESCV